MSEAIRFNYLLFSDIHLGADLVQHVRPWTAERLLKPARADDDIPPMLDWYRENRDPDRPWCLVIAGDMVDFIGMSISPQQDRPLRTALNDEEEVHGLGSAPDHGALKMHAVARRHPTVFRALARFVEAGNHLVVVRGNHDVDFHWDEVQKAFVEALASHLPTLSECETQTFASRIEFHPWFYYVHGLLYVEHGHQFDATCSYWHWLAPLSPSDPQRIHWTLSDWLLRHVVRPTPGLGADGHGENGMSHYLRFASASGLKGCLRLARRYLRTLRRIMRSGREFWSEKAKAIRLEHERRMDEIARGMRVSLEHVREIAALWPAPVSRGRLPVLRIAFLDRPLLVGVWLSWVAALAVLGLPMSGLLLYAAASGLLVASYLRWSTRKRRKEVDPIPVMKRAAKRIAELLPTRFVVMGHTHDPVVETLSDRATYINLGAWHVDDLEHEGGEASRTHLVLRWAEGAHRAEFCRWFPGQGPKVSEAGEIRASFQSK